MKRIAIIIIGLLASNNCKGMEAELALANDAMQPAAVGQRKVTRELLGDAFLDSDGNKIQARVFSQFKMSGGKASCGYHALHNALVLSKLIFSKDEPEQAALRKALIVEEEKESLFGSDEAPWRERIGQIRRDGEETDWLTSDEIKSLSAEKVISDVKGISHFFALGDIPWKNALRSDPLNFEDYDAIYDETEVKKEPSPFRQFMRLYHEAHKNCLGIFIMYDGEPNVLAKTLSWLKSFGISENDISLSQDSNHGHWHCIVVNKVDNKVQFILADSNNNASRLQDKRLNELIALLERRPIEELQLTIQNNLFTVRNMTVILIIAALVGAVAKKKLPQTSSSAKMVARSQYGNAEESKEI